jgi:hypothetical protein
LLKTKKRLETRSRLWKPYFLLIILPALFYLFAGLATESGQTTEPGPPAEFIQPIEFSHKTHVEKGEIPCEFCHIYARRSINSGAPVMASCFGCHRVIAGSDEDPQEAERKQNVGIQTKGRVNSLEKNS